MMKKLLFYFLAAALTLASCSKDDSLPLPEVSKIEIVGATEGQMKITTGQTVGFSVECENVAIDRYEWIVNEKIESESVRFDFTPAQRGTYDISVNLYNADGGVTTKQIGELQVVDPAPVIASITCNDEALSDPVDVAVGTAVKLAVEVSNVEVASYAWTIDGDTVETATGATLDIPASEQSGSLAVTVSAVNLDGIASEASAFTVNFNGPYKNGLWIYGSTAGGLGFFDPSGEGTFYEDNLYETVNGEGTGTTNGINDLSIYDNKLYILIPNNQSESSAVIACDSQTLKKEKVITAEGFDPATLQSSSEIYNLQVIDTSKFYILYNSTSASNKTGIGVLKVAPDGMNTFTTINATYGAVGVDGPCYSHMVKNGKYIMVGNGNKIAVIDTETDQVAQTIDVDEDRQVCDVVKGRDGKFYAVVAGKMDKSSPMWTWGMGTFTSSSSVLAIDPQTFDTTEYPLAIDGQSMVNVGNGLYGCMACASPTSDELFFKADGYSTSKVYCFNYQTGETRLFATTQRMLAKYMATDPSGLLYVPTTDYSNVYTEVYRISDGTKMTDIESKIAKVSGDGGIISTYSFAE